MEKDKLISLSNWECLDKTKTKETLLFVVAIVCNLTMHMLAYMHTCMHAHLHAHTHACTHGHEHTRTQTHISLSCCCWMSFLMMVIMHCMFTSSCPEANLSNLVDYQRWLTQLLHGDTAELETKFTHFILQNTFPISQQKESSIYESENESEWRGTISADMNRGELDRLTVDIEGRKRIRG